MDLPNDLSEKEFEVIHVSLRDYIGDARSIVVKRLEEEDKPIGIRQEPHESVFELTILLLARTHRRRRRTCYVVVGGELEGFIDSEEAEQFRKANIHERHKRTMKQINESWDEARRIYRTKGILQSLQHDLE